MANEKLDSANLTFSSLASIFNYVTDAILVLNNKGYVAAANPAAERLTGWTQAELISRMHFCEICKGVATCLEEADCSQCFKRHFQVPSFEMRVKAKDGHVFPVTASSTYLPDQPEELIVLILRDMSEQRRIERERIQRMVTNHIIHAQEEERKRVSRDLHDGVGQALYSILVGLKVVNQLGMGEQIENHLAEVQQMTARALEEVKNMAVELRPSALDDLGLVPGIRSYCKRFEQTFGIETEVRSNQSKRRYAPVVETALYRICQEAMTNAAKYADTDKIQVNLQDHDNELVMQIQDYGQGFDPDQVRAAGTGLGLYGIKERASLLGGQAEIQSKPGAGTLVTVRIRLNEQGEPFNVYSGIDRG